MAASLAVAVASLFAGMALFLGIVWFLLPFVASRTCGACGARSRRDARCEVCGAPAPPPPAAHPGALPYGFRTPRAQRPREPRLERGEAYNRGITRRMVTVATLAMGIGVGVRFVGMLGVFGGSIPAFFDGLLTVAGGVLAFVGFVFLDAA